MGLMTSDLSLSKLILTSKMFPLYFFLLHFTVAHSYVLCIVSLMSVEGCSTDLLHGHELTSSMTGFFSSLTASLFLPQQPFLDLYSQRSRRPPTLSFGVYLYLSLLLSVSTFCVACSFTAAATSLPLALPHVSPLVTCCVYEVAIFIPLFLVSLFHFFRMLSCDILTFLHFCFYWIVAAEIDSKCGKKCRGMTCSRVELVHFSHMFQPFHYLISAFPLCPHPDSLNLTQYKLKKLPSQK